MTIAPPGSFVDDSQRITVRIEGFNPRSRQIEFSTELHAETLSASYDAERLYGIDQALDLRFAVNFRPERSSTASALIVGFRRVTVRLLSPVSIEAQVDHLPSDAGDCHLICFENGATGRGPCLTCPDGAYQIRICC
jgi:hypothetical protein